MLFSSAVVPAHIDDTLLVVPVVLLTIPPTPEGPAATAWSTQAFVAGSDGI